MLAMVPWQILARARTPDGAELVLGRRGAEFSIRVHHVELMNSRAHLSEDTLGRRVAEAAAALSPTPHVIVGGLGMGFTLRAALDALPPGARVDVVELAPAVVAWNRGELGDVAGRPLADPRVRVIEADVGEVVRRAAPHGVHGLALDVDNGPDALTAAGNAALYGERGLAAARRALAPGGLYGVWSAFPAPAFTTRLRRATFDVSVEVVRAYPGGGAKHQLWLARAPTGARPSSR